MMKLFLSWSGHTSHEVALIFRDWIPSVLQSVQPYVSSEDIDKGTRWSTDIAQELETSLYGILCVTKSNLDSPWLNFEAGALSKSIEKGRVSPFLFDLKRSEVKEGPILQFQSTLLDKVDILKLLQGMNSSCDVNALDDTRLKKVFEVWWPKLETELNELLVKTKQTEHKTTKPKQEDKPSENAEILEELLELARFQQRFLASPENFLPSKYLNHAINQSVGIRLSPVAIRDLENGWSDYLSLIDSHKNIGSLPLSVVEEYTKKLSKPIDYIIRHASRSPRRNFIPKELLDIEEDM